MAPNVWLAFLVKRPPGEQRYKSTLIIYGCLVFASVIFIHVRAVVFLLVSLKCTERLHDNMVMAVLRAPVLFFDSNPLGRILNRFSEDIGCMDEILPQKFLLSIQLSLLLLTTFTLPIVANPWLLIFFLPVAVLVGFITRYYLKTSRDLKRLEVASRSPVLSHLAETMNGVDTIRTRSRQRAFEDKFHRYMFNMFWYMLQINFRYSCQSCRAMERGNGVPKSQDGHRLQRGFLKKKREIDKNEIDNFKKFMDRKKCID